MVGRGRIAAAPVFSRPEMQRELSNSRSKRTRKLASSKEEFSAWTPLAMQWVTTVSAREESEAISPAPLEMQWATLAFTREVTHYSNNATVETEVSFEIEEVVELPCMWQGSCDESSITCEGFDDDISESEEAAILHTSSNSSESLGSSITSNPKSISPAKWCYSQRWMMEKIAASTTTKVVMKTWNIRTSISPYQSRHVRIHLREILSRRQF